MKNLTYRYNPFKPTFGSTPPLLVGREEFIADFMGGLINGPGAPTRASLYTGGRGTGKTVLLNALEDAAKEQGWLIISETATKNFTKRIVEEHLPSLLSQVDPKTVQHKLSAIQIPFISGGITWDTILSHQAKQGLRNQIEFLTTLLSDNQVGLLITLDEIHKKQIEELREFFTAMQHLFRQEVEVAFVGVGLSTGIDEMLHDDVLTFLRRAEHNILGTLSEEQTLIAIKKPIMDNGRVISERACKVATAATNGYPFMVQLVGFYIWQQNLEVREITLENVQAGIDAARKKLGRFIHEPSLQDISSVGRMFLNAMAEDNGASRMADIAKRLGHNKGYVGQYRLRLIEAGFIKEVGHGQVDFQLPYLRDYLQEQALKK